MAGDCSAIFQVIYLIVCALLLLNCDSALLVLIHPVLWVKTLGADLGIFYRCLPIWPLGALKTQPSKFLGMITQRRVFPSECRFNHIYLTVQSEMGLAFEITSTYLTWRPGTFLLWMPLRQIPRLLTALLLVLRLTISERARA